MDAPADQAAPARPAVRPATGRAAAPTGVVAPPRRFAVGTASAARTAQPMPQPMPLSMPQPISQSMPQLLSEADLRTRPLLIAQPRRQAPVRQAAVVVPPSKQTWTRHVRAYVRLLSPVQVICWQIAALAVVLTVRQPWPVLVSASVAAALLTALTGVRVAGRWLYELTGLAAAFLTRTRRRDLPETGKALTLLTMLLPGVGVRTMETAQGQAMAVSHGGDLTAQLKPNALTPEVLNTLPMPAALLPDSSGAHHTFGVQLVFHVGVRPDRPRRLWVAVHAARTVTTPADDELTLALRNAVRRVRRALGRAGVPAEPVGEEQALSALAGLAHVTGGRNEVREDWKFWRTGAVSQATFRLAGWDTLTDSTARGAIGTLLAGIPGVAATVSVGAVSDGARTARRGDPTSAATLRLAATTEAAITAAANTMSDRLAPSGVRLARLDGAHLTGVAASLPIGVFLP